MLVDYLQALYMRYVDNSACIKIWLCYTTFMTTLKIKRELAIKNIRVYPSTLTLLQIASNKEGKTIARLIHEAICKQYAGN